MSGFGVRRTAMAMAGLAAAVFAGGGAPRVPVQAPPPPAGPAQQIVDTERAFAQATAQTGIGPAFRQFAAPNAVMFLPDPVPAAQPLATARWPGELTWRAQYVGVAGSGDLAFSAGPSLLKAAGERSGGYYLSIWKRQADGSWKFVLDRAADMPTPVVPGGVQAATVLATDPPPGPPTSEGMREADGALNVALPKGASPAFAARLDDQAVLVRQGRPIAAGRRKALTLVADSPPILDAFTLGAGRSQDGTLGYTYGRARSMGPTGSQAGFYVRVWRSTPQGWRLLVDHLAER